MRVLYLSFYYPPDLCPGSFRNAALVQALVKRLPANSTIDVITTQPNRYADFTTQAAAEEVIQNVRIRRVALPSHNSGMVDQSWAFWTYARTVLRMSEEADYDLVFASSGRLLTAALAATISRRKQIGLYLDIRDIFVDTIDDALSRKLTWFMKPLFSGLEKWTIRRAKCVNLVSEGFRGYFEDRYPATDLSFFTNGIDEAFIHAQPQIATSSSGGTLSIVYAGNMGEGQGLHHIVAQLAQRLAGRAHLRLIGAGGRRDQLLASVEAAGCKNVSIEPPMRREELIDAYRSADVLFLHLNDYNAFKKVLPSKLFEYASLGKPILAGVGGYAAEFVAHHIENAAVFAPCDVEGAVRAFDSLELVSRPRPTFVEKYARTNIMDAMADDIIATAEAA